MTRHARKWLAAAGFHLLVAVIVLYTCFPFCWAVVSSLTPSADLFRAELVPAHPTLANYAAVFRDQPFGRYLLNSVVVAGGVVLLALLLGLTAAYALGRIAFRGRSALLLAMLGVSMFPQVAVLSGLFELVRAFGLYNSLAGLILSYLIFTLPFTVWVLTAFMRELPAEMEEAAVVDGARPGQVLRHVYVPLLAPALVTTGLLAAIAAWNEFVFALTFTLDRNRTVPVAIAQISGASEHELPWGTIMAASVIVTVPLVALVLLFQRRIVSGLTAGAVKG